MKQYVVWEIREDVGLKFCARYKSKKRAFDFVKNFKSGCPKDNYLVQEIIVILETK